MFEPTEEKLLPDLSPREELVLLARTLWREGYDDHLAGHITFKQADGTFLCSPWFLQWNELLPEHVIRIDGEGKKIEGHWPVPIGISLHLELHRLRPDVAVALHGHPRYGTIWADAVRLPPCHDRGSALGGGQLVMVDQAAGTVDDPANARAAVEAMGQADMALLANHGVFVLGRSIRAVHQRAVALEQRCRRALLVEVIGGGRGLAEEVTAGLERSDSTGFIGFWEAAVRQELRLDPSLLRQGTPEPSG